MKLLIHAVAILTTLFSLSSFATTLSLNAGDSVTIRPNTVVTVTCEFGTGGGKVTCIPHCMQRFADGSCANYGADFCAVNPVCIKYCSKRFNDGSCATYGEDICKP